MSAALGVLLGALGAALYLAFTALRARELARRGASFVLLTYPLSLALALSGVLVAALFGSRAMVLGAAAGLVLARLAGQALVGRRT